MKILFIASEAFPLAKVGGLANVTSSLAIALHDSGHEPCGLGQLVAMRYGAIPVVRYTGGLADAVKDVAAIDGNGFLFQNYTVSDMLEAIKRAEASFYHRTEWHNLIRRDTKPDFSWKAPASKYGEICLRAVRTSGAQ